MVSSDDEAEEVPQTVSNYHLVNERDEPVSFAELPVQWNDGESPDVKKKQVFIHGTTDNGLQKMYKQVMAWKFDLLNEQPEISVLLKDNNWIKLQKPRKSFESTIRTILITVQSIHFLKNNPESSGKALWDYMSKVFSLYEPRPSLNDLVDHMTLIGDAVEKDDTLTKSKFLENFLEERPPKRIYIKEDVGSTSDCGFIVADDMIDEQEEDDGSDEENDLFDSVCAICDNGGELLCCEGRCMRSFHATRDAGADSMCESLGLSDRQVEEIQNFLCKNCRYKQHQCFVCGELGSSDKSSGAEVFPCVSATCGCFYHPLCVAKLLRKDSEHDAEELKKKIVKGEPFTCPIHKCCVCNQGEDKTNPDLQFAVCRRCPTAYHRKCLPRKIAFEENDSEGIFQRAWEGLMPNRILIYCLKHKIDDELATPERNHIKFPDLGDKRKRKFTNFSISVERVMPKTKSLVSEHSSEKRSISLHMKGKAPAALNRVVSSTKNEGRASGVDSLKRQKFTDTSRKTMNKASSVMGIKSTTDASKSSLGEQLYSLLGGKGSESGNSTMEDMSDGESKPTTVKPSADEISSSFALDADSKRRILNLMKDSSTITLEEIKRKHKMPTTHAYSLRSAVDKTITMGKVEGSIEAIRAALQKIDEGCNIEDAKAVCEPELLNQIAKWKSKLKVYLAPFLYGMRYTSFGRHFTKVEKLIEIVDILHWYVEDGDMIVDFCCGANDFSSLMKKKLDERRKKCFYKNYDLLQAKNDFNFEQRDWMTVRPKELPAGSKLIMGLNPPFGVNATLANKFIDKALEFMPKLLILIVPQETERLDKKRPPYDLVWEDNQLLVGKSFYLPGSVDVNDKQMEDWNINPPPLFLWSRSDWTFKHKEIAQQHGHLSRVSAEVHLEEKHHGVHGSFGKEIHLEDQFEKRSSDDENMKLEENVNNKCDSEFLVLDNYNNGVTSMLLDDSPVQEETDKPFKGQGSDTGINFYKEIGDPQKHDIHSHGRSRTNENQEKSYGKAELVRSLDEKFTDFKKNDRYSIPHHPSSSMADSRLLEGLSRVSMETPSFDDAGKEIYSNLDHLNVSSSNMQSQIEYGGNWEDSMTKRYSLNHEEPYSSLNNNIWSNSIHPEPDHGFRNSEEQPPPYMGYQRGGMDGYGYRSSLIGDIDQTYSRESDIRSSIRLYGQQAPDSFNQPTFLGGGNSEFSSPFNQNSFLGGPALDSSYGRTNTSAMQRYAPRLDELNHNRMHTPGSDPSSNRNGFHDPSAHQRGYQSGSRGFASGPYFPRQYNSSGWLNE